jgi:hypothetical protein
MWTIVATDSSESDFAPFSDCAGACPVGVGAAVGVCPAGAGAVAAELGVEEAGVSAGACVLVAGGALDIPGAFGNSVDVEAAGAVWPMSEPASTGNTTRSRRMRDFIRTFDRCWFLLL